jgi:hypothetical protein
VPKLFFKPIRPLSEEELEQVVALRDAPETKKAIDLTVYQTDTANAPALEQKPSLFEEAEEPTKKVEEPVEEEEEEEAPKRVVKKSKAAPKEEEDDDLSDIVSAWDDDE